MPKRKREEEIEFVEEIPIKAGGGTRWAQILLPLTRPGGIGRHALVRTCETPLQASDAQSNLKQRRVKIPHPNGDWEFFARGVEVYAIYRGAKPPKAVRGGRNVGVRRAQRAR